MNPLIHSDAIGAHWQNIITGLRVSVLVCWAVIGAWGVPCMMRVMRGKGQHPIDFFWSAMAILATGLVALQIRSLAGVTPPNADPITAFGLFCFIVAAATLFATRARSAPIGHQFAVFLSLSVMLSLVGVAGALS